VSIYYLNGVAETIKFRVILGLRALERW